MDKKRAAKQHFHDLALDALALVFPANCVGCGRDNRALCRGCQNHLSELLRKPPISSRILPEVGVPLVTGCEYRAVVRKLVSALKHEDRPHLARPLAKLTKAVLEHAIRAGLGSCAEREWQNVRVVFVPSRRKREWQRGYHHLVTLLAAAGVPRFARVRALAAARGRTTQVGLSQKQRAENAARIHVRESAAGTLRECNLPVVVFDDVTTTGASIRASVRALQQRHIRVIAAAALCRVPRRAVASSNRVCAATANGNCFEQRTT
jgi:predicted amidophosphoribosyltransferase